MLHFGAALILTEAHVANPVQAVFDATDLPEARPVEVFGQPCAILQMPLSSAAIPFVDGAMFGELRLTFSFTTGGLLH
jgi:hypothetical protein